VDLAELPSLSLSLSSFLFAHNGWAPFSLCDSDYLGTSSLSVREKLARYFESKVTFFFLFLFLFLFLSSFTFTFTFAFAFALCMTFL